MRVVGGGLVGAVGLEACVRTGVGRNTRSSGSLTAAVVDATARVAGGVGVRGGAGAWRGARAGLETPEMLGQRARGC